MDLRRYPLIALAACTGDPADSGAPAGDTSFSAIRDEILLPTCGFSTCHGSGTGGLTITAEGAYAALVEAPSSISPGDILVIPGDPDGSYLVKKLDGAADIVGGPMPVGAPLSASDLSRIRTWIAAGAPND